MKKFLPAIITAVILSALFGAIAFDFRRQLDKAIDGPIDGLYQAQIVFERQGKWYAVIQEIQISKVKGGSVEMSSVHQDKFLLVRVNHSEIDPTLHGIGYFAQITEGQIRFLKFSELPRNSPP